MPDDHAPTVSEELRVRGGLPNFFAKAQAGDPVTVAYLEDNITHPATRQRRVYGLLARRGFTGDAVCAVSGAARRHRRSRRSIAPTRVHVAEVGQVVIYRSVRR